MANVNVNFSENCGKVKIMHSVNNGPAGSLVRGTSNDEYFINAKIPYARNHDASFCATYGGEHTVDVHAIFKNFDADENDPASYDFEMTDKYLKKIESVGTKTFYRLGSKIEHGKKFGTYPPKDFAKWARICEHIIRHYTEGWADGFKMDIEYWEIWNEPDCHNPDGSTPCWQGTYDQFVDLFVIAFKHLKGCFPHLKIGGPALTSAWLDEYNKPLFDALKENGLVIDFFSFHGYTKYPIDFYEQGEKAYALLKEYGCEDKTELILNEWNYVRGWLGEEFLYSIKTIMGLKGSSFTAATMCEGQRSHLDHMMYYDARPSAFNGMFSPYLMEPLKGYYPFLMFSKLYDMDYCAKSSQDDSDIYTVAAASGNTAGLMITYYNEDDSMSAKEVKIDFSGYSVGEGAVVDYYLLDENHNAELVRSEKVTSSDFTSYLNMELYSTYLIIVH